MIKLLSIILMLASLQAGSQGINTGTSTLVPARDYTGYTRNMCDAVGRGAFEYH